MAELARELGISPSSFQRNLEGSEPGFARGIRLADILNVSADWLSDDTQDWPPPKTADEQIVQAVRAAFPASAAGLSGEERELISYWRMLSPTHRAKVLGVALGLANATDATPHEAEESAEMGADLLEKLDESERQHKERVRRPKSGGDKAS